MKKRTWLAVSAAIGIICASNTVSARGSARETFREPVAVRGIVSALAGPQKFQLDDGTTVSVSAGTKWVGISDGAHVAPGDPVLVVGTVTPLDGGAIISAEGVRRLAAAAGTSREASPIEKAGAGAAAASAESESPPDCTDCTDADDSEDGSTENQGEGSNQSAAQGGVALSHTGALMELLPPDAFVLDDGRRYSVDRQTVFDSPLVSYDSLRTGLLLDVEAVYATGASNRVTHIGYEGDEQAGDGVFAIDGRIASVSRTLLQLEDGEVLQMLPTTRFLGDADSTANLRTGWDVTVDALRSSTGDLLALSVRARDPDPPTIENEDHEPHEAFVITAPGADGRQVAQRLGATVLGRVGSTGWLYWWTEDIDDELLVSISQDPGVRAVEPNYRFRDPESSRKRHPIVDRTYTPKNLYEQPAMTQSGLVKAQALSTGAGLVVAVIDTGVDPSQPLLSGRLAAGGLDLVDGDMTPWETRNGLDDNGNGEIDEAAGHGTFVASLLALAAPAAQILPYRIMDDDGGGTTWALALALADAIENHVSVINLSLVYHRRSRVIDLLLEKAAADGIVVVASSGNDGNASVPFPASDSHVLGVTALRADGADLATFANRGPNVIVAAPGENVLGALDGDRFGTWSGTSMAAPFVSGAVALLRSVDRTVDPEIIRLALEQAGSPLKNGSWEGVRLNAVAVLNKIGGR